MRVDKPDPGEVAVSGVAAGPSLTLDQLRTLVAVVDLGSFDAAAAHLHITPSAVSQRIRALEDSSGRILVRRDRPIAPTESGEALLRTARQMLHLEDVVAADLAGDGQGSGGGLVVVPVACNADSLATWFLDALAAVPGRTEVVFDVRREDESRSAELLRRGEVMAAVTGEAAPVAGCRSTRLGALRYVGCASPWFVERYLPDGLTPSGLGAAPVVEFDRSDGLQDGFYRRLARRPFTGPRHHIPSTHDHARAIAAGLGWGLLPESMATPLLAAGDLVPLGDAPPLDVPLHWQHWKVRSPALDRLTEAVLATARAELRS